MSQSQKRNAISSQMKSPSSNVTQENFDKAVRAYNYDNDGYHYELKTEGPWLRVLHNAFKEIGINATFHSCVIYWKWRSEKLGASWHVELKNPTNPEQVSRFIMEYT